MLLEDVVLYTTFDDDDETDFFVVSFQHLTSRMMVQSPLVFLISSVTSAHIRQLKSERKGTRLRSFVRSTEYCYDYQSCPSLVIYFTDSVMTMF